MASMTITEFILARVAEDEERAQFVARQIEGNNWTPHEPWRLSWHDEYDLLCIEPSRALVECEAKRRIVELHDGSHECSTYDHTGDIDNCTWCLNTEDCSTMRLLAAIWADHPDFREEWR